MAAGTPEALARVKVERQTPPDALRQLMRLRDQARIERDHAAQWREYERASLIGEEERRLATEVEETLATWRARVVESKGIIGAAEVAEVSRLDPISAWFRLSYSFSVVALGVIEELAG